jgi:tRNA(Arg) A34 adenosine deaminase TadA
MALIDLAVRQALRSACRHRVGAVLVAGNRVLAVAPNLHRNSPMVDFRHATFHAEEAVLRRAKATTTGTEIFVARVNRSGTPMLARPCPRCQQALATAGVTRAHYTTGHGTTGTLTIPHLPPAGRDQPSRWSATEQRTQSLPEGAC